MYSVVDNDLRSGLRNANVDKIVEKYKIFFELFQKITLRKDKDLEDANSKSPKKKKAYDKQTPKEIEEKLNKFFDEDDD